MNQRKCQGFVVALTLGILGLGAGISYIGGKWYDRHRESAAHARDELSSTEFFFSAADGLFDIVGEIMVSFPGYSGQSASVMLTKQQSKVVVQPLTLPGVKYLSQIVPWVFFYVRGPEDTVPRKMLIQCPARTVAGKNVQYTVTGMEYGIRCVATTTSV